MLLLHNRREPCSPKLAWHRLPAALMALLASCSSHGQVGCRDKPGQTCHTDGLLGCSGGCCLLTTAQVTAQHPSEGQQKRREQSPLPPVSAVLMARGTWVLPHLHAVPHGDLTGLHAASPEHNTHSAQRESTFSFTVSGTPCVVFGMWLAGLCCSERSHPSSSSAPCPH